MSSGPTALPAIIGRSDLVIRGDLAPPTFGLMSVENVGGMNLEWFEKSLPWAATFVQTALRVLHDPHVNMSLIPPTFTDGHGPDSRFYLPLIEEMKRHGLVSEVTEPPAVILSLFAVVKDPLTKTARPIENGRPTVAASHNSGELHIPGAAQISKVLVNFRGRTPFIVHLDVRNCYFQVPSTRGSEHGFRAGNRFFQWNVLTMGWSPACFVAQSLVMSLLLAASPYPIPQPLLDASSPPGIVELNNGHAVALNVYDSAMILCDDRSASRKWRSGIVDRARCAHVRLKYILTEEDTPLFVYCGFEITVCKDGLSWRVDPATVNTWLEIIKRPLMPSPRTLWAFAGYLGFFFSVLRIPPRSMGFIRQAQSTMGQVQNHEWDVPRHDLSDVIRRCCELVLRTPALNSYIHRSCWKIPTTCVVYAFDATPSRWNFSRIDLGAESYEDVRTGELPSDTHIDVSEGTGCSKCILELSATNPALAVIIGDNIPTLRAFYLASSPSDALLRLISCCGVRSIATTILFVDVPSEDNVADIGSRPHLKFSEENIRYRLHACIRRAHAALQQFHATGVTYFPRDPRLEPAPEE